MSLNTKRWIIAALGGLFLLSLLFVQWEEVRRRNIEAGLTHAPPDVPASSAECVRCHRQITPGIIEHWQGSTHAHKGVGCVECHAAAEKDADGFAHYGAHIATVVTPRDCSRCHPAVYEEFQGSRHAHGGEILSSLDNLLAETVEGAKMPFDPHSPTPGVGSSKVEGMAGVRLGCRQCHGSVVALKSTEGGVVSRDDLKPGADGKPTNADAVAKVVRTSDGRPIYDAGSWPNTGIGRINLDGSLGSCSACHSRHDFSPRRARQPENCGKCHLGPDHPQKEIYEESKHGIAYRDLRDQMNLGSKSWVLGKDYSAAPTCATCHMSGNVRNGGKITHDPGKRISWTNRPPLSLRMDTDASGQIVTESDEQVRRKLVSDSAEAKRTRMREVCSACHTPDYVSNFYEQYDDLLLLYNEKFAKPGLALMKKLVDLGLRTPQDFDEPIEWTWFYLWHHEGRRARHGAAMMAPDYTQWHGLYEVAERFYVHLLPEARQIADRARTQGKADQAMALLTLIDDLLARPEHAWFRKEAEKPSEVAPAASDEEAPTP